MIKKYTEVPALVGFGISNGEQVKELSSYCDGAIIGKRFGKGYCGRKNSGGKYRGTS